MNDLRKQLSATISRALERGLLMATGGNVSVRVPDAESMLITPSNLDYRTMRTTDLCVVALNSEPIECPHAPSVETPMHAAIYRNRPDVGAVFHTHLPYSSALALMGKPVPALFDEQARFLGEKIGTVPYAMSGTAELAELVGQAVTDRNNAYILQNHGAICLGYNLERALHNVEVLEKCAQAYLLALASGATPSTLPPNTRELALAKLRAEQDDIAAGNTPTSGE